MQEILTELYSTVAILAYIPWNCPKGTRPEGWFLSDDLLYESLNKVGREILCHGFHE